MPPWEGALELRSAPVKISGTARADNGMWGSTVDARGSKNHGKNTGIRRRGILRRAPNPTNVVGLATMQDRPGFARFAANSGTPRERETAVHDSQIDQCVSYFIAAAIEWSPLRRECETRGAKNRKGEIFH